jgi:hypothetical protein
MPRTDPDARPAATTRDALRARRSAALRLWVASLTGVLVLTAAVPCAGQAPRSTSLNALALEWAKGRFASPLTCEFEGKNVRGIRRILISEGPQKFHPPVNKLQFVDIDADDATRCTTDLGEDQPTIVGVLHFRLLGQHNSSDLASKDFQATLKRERGFDFDIVSGLLHLRSVGAAAGEARRVDFKGGHVALQRIRKGSDAALLLRDFASPRKLLLQLEAKDGTRLSFPIFIADTP